MEGGPGAGGGGRTGSRSLTDAEFVSWLTFSFLYKLALLTLSTSFSKETLT